MRRTLIIVAAIIVLLGVGGFVYWKYFTGGPSLAVTKTTLPSADTAPVGAGQSDVAITEGAAALNVEQVTSRLTKISVGPVVPGVAVVPVYASSSAPVTTATSTKAKKAPPAPPLVVVDTAVEFLERTSGNIFSYLLRGKTLTRTSNKTIPGIQSALWAPSGKTAFVTYLSGNTLSTINTYGIAADGGGGFFLPTGITSIAVSSTSVMTLASGATGSVASRSKLDGSSPATAWSSPLSSLRIAFAGTKGYVAFSKPAESLDGDLFAVSPAGAFTRIAGPYPGLVALPSHKGDVVLITQSNAGVMQGALVNTVTGAFSVLPIGTIADKCVWAGSDTVIYCGVPQNPSTDASYPDDWYQGAVHFTDRIWRVDVAGRFVQLVFDPATVKGMGALDAEALALDGAGTTLVFVNKNDGSLWSYKL